MGLRTSQCQDRQEMAVAGGLPCPSDCGSVTRKRLKIQGPGVTSRGSDSVGLGGAWGLRFRTLSGDSDEGSVTHCLSKC